MSDPNAIAYVGEPHAPSDDSVQWRRVAKGTPLIKSWQVIVVVIAGILLNILDDMVSIYAEIGMKLLWFVLAGVVAVALVSLIHSYLAWRKMAYAVSDDAVFVHSGIFFRNQRHARLNRIQGVEVNRPFLARLFYLASVNVETGGGSYSNVTIEFLKEADAEQLRREILAKAAGLKAGRPAGSGISTADGSPMGAGVSAEMVEFPQAPEKKLFELPLSMLAGSLVRNMGDWFTIVLSLVFLVVAVWLGTWEALVFLAPLITVGVAIIWSTFNSNYGFTFALSPDGMRTRSGFLSTHNQTIPPGRVQAILLHQPILWRRKDWWRVDVNVAGYAGKDSKSKSQERLSKNTVLPVAPRDDALEALWIGWVILAPRIRSAC